ncbi:hypothetical protein AB9E11_35800, partial [Rhizobium leguminosarum]
LADRSRACRHCPRSASRRELLGMVEYDVDYGYFGKEHDLEWSCRLNPDTLNWEQYLKTTGWRGDKRSFADRCRISFGRCCQGA